MKQLEVLKKRLPPGIDVRISSKNILTFRVRFRRRGYPDQIQTFLDEKLFTDRANVICISDEAHRSQVNLNQKVRIKHYERRVSEGATIKGKAMFVCSNRSIAYELL